MRKNIILPFAVALGLGATSIIPQIALAGSTMHVSIDMGTVISADHERDRAMLALKILEDRPNLDIETYKREAAKIIEEFIATREAAYRELRAVEVLRASAEAKRPPLFKGRRSDSATIRSDSGKFADWEVVEVSQRQVRQNANGENWAKVTRVPDGRGVEMKVYARSPKHDSARGRTHLTEEAIVTYKMKEEELQRRARADAYSLLTLGFLSS